MSCCIDFNTNYFGMFYGHPERGHWKFREEGTDMVEAVKEDTAMVHQERIETKERLKKIEESLAHLIVRVERLEEGCILCEDDGK